MVDDDGEPASLDELLGTVMQYAVVSGQKVHRSELTHECVPPCFLGNIKRENAADAAFECRFQNIDAWAKLQAKDRRRRELAASPLGRSRCGPASAVAKEGGGG